MKPTIAVCGAVGREMDEVVSAVARSSQLQAIAVRWPDRTAFDSARALPAAGWLVLGSDGAYTDLAREVTSGRVSAPLVVIGGSSAPATAACWLPRRPSDAVLVALLAQIAVPVAVEPTALQIPASEPPPSRSWRRKSDMIIGSSPAMAQLLAALDRLAPSVAPVLVMGESGTGKELVARALHYTGPRRGASFVPINCGAIPDNLFEAELFGYQRGAFTGAVSSRPGAFEAADNGTLFLDELGEMSLHMQVKLLRVLETGEVTRLGSNESRRCNVRLVAATNRKLEAEVRAGRFREDLFYRVSVCPLVIPPLRDRPEDIPPIATHHLEQIARREQRPPARLTAAALEKLLSHRWPGNVRELANALERAVLLAPEGAIDAPHLLLPEDAAPLIMPYRDAKERFEHGYYSNVLRTTGGNVSLAAKLAQKTRKEVYDALRRLGLEAGVYRESSGSMPVAARAAGETKEPS
ncbi:MAG TPA: sigma-54 dependent transcriptional regulator [Polyangiaceae bacterium]